MKPVEFKGQNSTTMPVEGEEGRLPICMTDKGFITCWKLSFADRVRAVVFGRVWSYNYTPKCYHQISMECMRDIFVKLRAHKKCRSWIYKKRRRHGK